MKTGRSTAQIFEEKPHRFVMEQILSRISPPAQGTQAAESLHLHKIISSPLFLKGTSDPEPVQIKKTGFQLEQNYIYFVSAACNNLSGGMLKMSLYPFCGGI